MRVFVAFLQGDCGLVRSLLVFSGTMSHPPLAFAPYRGLIALPLVLLLLSVFGAAAQGPELRVVVAGSAPFVMEGAGPPEGLSVDIWSALERETGVTGRLEAVGDVATAIDLVALGEADVAVGPISITAERAGRVRFTQPYFGASLGILAPPSVSLLDRFAPFLSTTFAVGAIALLTVLVLVGTLFWLAERRINPQHFPEDTVQGVGNGVWMALVTMTTVGYGDRVPISAAGRILAGTWMLVSLVIASSLTAFLATALTLSQLEGSTIETADELRGRRVGVVAGTTSETFAADYGARLVSFTTIDDAVDALVGGALDAVVFDRPILRYVLEQNPQIDLRLAAASYQPQNYGFALGRDSAFADQLDRAILELQDNGEVAEIEARWLGLAP